MKTNRTMVDVMRQLEKELGPKEGLKMFEWYCENYHVHAGSEIPPTILYEVFGE